MANTVYPNFILKNKLKNILKTKLDTKALMIVDESLKAEPGDIVKINTYTYSNDGGVEKLGVGQKNTKRGSIAYTTSQYEVALGQQVFDYYDEEFRKDPLIVDHMMTGASQVMVNDFNDEYFTELGKATLVQEYTGSFNYDVVVDAIGLMNIEDENGLFLIINPSLKADVRKDPSFKASQQGEILYTGQIGNISGVPVLVSKEVINASLASKEAVTLFTKVDSEIEQERDAETRKNTVIMRKVNLIALTDATKVVKITKASQRKRSSSNENNENKESEQDLDLEK